MAITSNFYIGILLSTWKMFTVFVEKACSAWYALVHATLRDNTFSLAGK